MDNRMTEQKACGQAILESDSHAGGIQTVTGLIYWLQTIAADGDCNVDRDTVADTCEAAAKRLKSMQESLQSEVARIEKLQPFFTEVSRAVDEARKPQH
jgi:hypothetical protein